MAKDVISASSAAALLNTHGGPGLVFHAPLGTPFPDDIDDVVNIAGGANQWTPKTGWTALGITKNGINIDRGFTGVKREADQSYGAYDNRPTSYTATVSTELLETSPVALQVAWVGGPITQGTKIQAVAAADIAAGATSFSVASGSVGNPSSIASGDYISIGNGPDQEWGQVVSNTTGTVTLSSPLDYAHASGSLVVRFSKNSLAFGTSRNIPARLLAVVAPLGYDDPSAGGNLNGLRMWAFRRVKLADGQRQIQLSNSGDWSLPVSFDIFQDLTIADPEFNSFVMYEYAY